MRYLFLASFLIYLGLSICSYGDEDAFGFDPDTWFVVYDDFCFTTAELYNHDYIVIVVEHSPFCHCKEQPEAYRELVREYGNK